MYSKPMIKAYDTLIQGDEDSSESDKIDGLKTCHLCGKAKCGQRKGRVNCCKCGRVFCIQQLEKKFNMSATKGQTDFVCPRCLHICCCVTNCTLGPPHVHCKVLKVRQNKKRYREMAKKEAEADLLKKQQMMNNQPYFQPYPPMSSVSVFPSTPANQPYIPIIPHTNSFPLFPNFDGSNGDSLFSPHGFTPRVEYTINEGLSNGLTELHDALFDHNIDQSFIDKNSTIKSGLEEYFNKRITWSPDVIKERHKWLYQQALELEQKASKVDAVLHTVDQFNNNAIKVTVKWDMRNNILNPKASTVIPGLYTIVKKYPNILFSLNPSTNYSEYLNNCCVSITFINTKTTDSNLQFLQLQYCIDILSQSFSHFKEVILTVRWGDNKTQSILKIEKNEDELKKLMQFCISAGKEYHKSENERYCYRIYYKRHADDPTIEYLPVLALLLKQVSKKYPNVIFSLEEMICYDDYVNCLLVFNSNCDITDIINLYKDTIEITRE